MKIKRVVGEGSYGAVVICEKDGKDYAMKTVRGDYYGLVSLQEVDVMNGISNPFLVSARKTYIEDNSTLLFMDLADETLHRYKISGEGELRMIVFQMITGLAFLEKRKIIHGDIKANNYLCFRNSHGIPLNVRLTDFSLACRAYGVPPMFRMYCSIYRSVESWFSEAECKSDVWALGCCIYELLTRESQLFPGQDERYDDRYSDTLAERVLESPDGSRMKIHRRWKPSFDIYVSILGQFADATNQPLTRKFRKRVDDADLRVQKFPKPLNVFVRNWKLIYSDLPGYLREMLTVDPASRPSALDLFHSHYFDRERGILADQLSRYYLDRGIPLSEGEVVLLDGAVKYHSGRFPLEYDEVTFFLTRPHITRVTSVLAMDMYSKCKHIERNEILKLTCLFISNKLTDPGNLDYSLYSGNDNAKQVEIIDYEAEVCRTLNYVLYPEDDKIFELTDEQLFAFYI